MSKEIGYDKAIYGLTEGIHPILFEVEELNVLISTRNLSNFITGRYDPTPAWSTIWEKILEWLTSEEYSVSWIPTLDTTYTRDANLPDGIEMNAIECSFKWFRKHVLYSIVSKNEVIEEYESAIGHKSKQLPIVRMRGDCNSEAIMVFAYEWTLFNNLDSRYWAEEILDNIWSNPEFYKIWIVSQHH